MHQRALPFDDFTLFTNFCAECYNPNAGDISMHPTIRTLSTLHIFFRLGAVNHALGYPDVLAPTRHNPF